MTDGEYRRSTYSDSFTTSGLVGVTAAFSGGGDLAYTDRHGHRTAARIPTVHGRLEWGDSGNAHDFRFLASLTDRLPKMTLPGPGYIHFRSGRAKISREAYPDLDEFWVDLVGCYHKELAALGEAGCRYVQLDETSLAKFGDPKIRRALTDRGDNWENLLEVYIRAINAVVEGAPAGMRIGVHLCRGNNRGHWQAEGGYDLIAAKMFADVAVDFFFLEYDSPRAGTFAPLAEVPDGKTVVLGLVSTKVGELEPADLLKRRLEEASRYVPIRAIGPQPAVRLRKRDGGKSDFIRRTRSQAPAGCRGRACRLGRLRPMDCRFNGIDS